MKRLLQNHGIELYEILFGLFRRQEKLPEGTTTKEVVEMTDDERRSFITRLSCCTQAQLGNTDLTLDQLKAYARRTHEPVVVLQVPNKPAAPAHAA